MIEWITGESVRLYRNRASSGRNGAFVNILGILSLESAGSVRHIVNHDFAAVLHFVLVSEIKFNGICRPSKSETNLTSDIKSSGIICCGFKLTYCHTDSTGDQTVKVENWTHIHLSFNKRKEFNSPSVSWCFLIPFPTSSDHWGDSSETPLIVIIFEKATRFTCSSDNRFVLPLFGLHNLWSLNLWSLKRSLLLLRIIRGSHQSYKNKWH